MASASRLKTSRAAKAPRGKNSVIDSRQRELAEQENKLQAQIDALQRTISEAPTRAAEKARRDRDALIASSRGFHLQSVVPDSRYGQGNGGGVRRAGGARPMLRAERSAARTQTLALVVAVAVAVIWFLSHYLG